MNEDINQQILTEIRHLRRSNNAGIFFVVIVLIAAGIYLPLRLGLLRPRAIIQTEPDSWASVRRAMDHFDYDTASAIAQRLVRRYPNDYYGHAYLGNIALATGHLNEAEGHYARACEILPSDENQSMLTAIQKRIKNDTATNSANDPKSK